MLVPPEVSRDLVDAVSVDHQELAHGSAAVLREQFVRRRGVPPRSYRRTFTGTS